MLRYLTSTLFCEGREDERFLVEVITRQLADLGLKGDGFSAGAVLPQPCRTVKDAASIDGAVRAIASDFHLIFVHNDWNERGKIDALRSRIASSLSGKTRIVGVVPMRETEAWVLADPDAFPKGSTVADLPQRPHELEKLPDPKKTLDAALGRGFEQQLAEFIGERISLDRLALVPAYQTFLTDLTNVLKELHYL